MSNRSQRARPVLAGVAAPFVLLAAALAAATPAAAERDVSPARVGGDDRYGTAAEIAELTFPGGSGVAILANGLDFADALAAAPLSRSADAPLLLIQRERIPEDTHRALTALGVREVVLLGGPEAISTGLEDDLGHRFDRVTRLEGPTRVETAIRIARSVEESPNASIGEIGGARTAMVVSASAAADAVLASSLAAAQADPFPILFTARDHLTPATEQALRDLQIDQALVVGGADVVGDAVAQRLGEQGIEPTRLAGPDRLGTATRVADHARGVFGWTVELVNLVRGDDFADALTAGPHAGRAGAPVLLTASPDVLGDRTAAWLSERCDGISSIRAIGGDAAVTPAVLGEAVEHAERCHDGTGEYGTETVQTSDFPDPSGDTALLSDVRVSGHDDFDRVVLEFERGDVPTHRVGYREPPVREDGSGHEVEVAGDAFLEVRAVPGATYDPLSEDARRTYHGPDEITPTDTDVVLEVEKVADYEGHLAWVLGIDGGERPFAVTVLQDPLRLVVDVDTGS